MVKPILIITVFLLLAACANHDISKDQKLEKSPCACTELPNHAA